MKYILLILSFGGLYSAPLHNVKECNAAIEKVYALAPRISALTPLVSDDPGPVNVFSIPHEVVQRVVGHDDFGVVTTVRWHVGHITVVQIFPEKFDAPPTFKCVERK